MFPLFIENSTLELKRWNVDLEIRSRPNPKIGFDIHAISFYNFELFSPFKQDRCVF